MNTRRAIDESPSQVVLSVAFNQDASCFAVTYDTGYSVFLSETCKLKEAHGFNGGIGLTEMLGKSNFLALVGGGRQPKFPQNKLIIWDAAKQKVAIMLEFCSQIYRVRLSRTHIAVALQNSVQLYKFSSPPERLAFYETADNLHGLCCLSKNVVAFPGRTPGQVQLVELNSQNVSIIPAHSSALRALDLSSDGEILVTASEVGTLLRVYSTANCARIAELRRGVDQASIFSLRISPSGSLLAVTSDKSTMHIFDLPHLPRTIDDWQEISRRSTSPVGNEDASTNKWGVLGKIPLMPRVFSDVYSIASARFEVGDDDPSNSSRTSQAYRTPGMSSSTPAKGIVGWKSDQVLFAIGGGRDARWEKFVLLEDEEGKRRLIRDGWKRYPNP